MTVPTQAVTLDALPLKRVLALEESGNELFPNEPTAEEKPLALLGRIDFGQSVEKDSKKAKAGKEAAPAVPPVWPWQSLVDNLQQAHQELNIILDLITHVEANDAITVANMAKPKPLPAEATNDLSLRASSKIRQFRDVGNYLRRTAQELERQVEKEAVFYGTLMRLQRNWKVKRQRGVAAGPGGSAGFSIDASFALPPEAMLMLSGRATALSSVNLDQDPVGLLQARRPAGCSLSNLNLSLRTSQLGKTIWERANKMEEDVGSTTEDATGEASDGQGVEQGNQTRTEHGIESRVEAGATLTHAFLRQTQGAIYDEQVFEWVGREAVLPSSGMNVIGIGDACLQFSLGDSATLTLELSETQKESKSNRSGDYDSPAVNGEDDTAGKWGTLRPLPVNHTSERSFGQVLSPRLRGQRVVPNDSSLVAGLHQAYHQCMFGYPFEIDPGLVTFKMGVGKSGDAAPRRTKEGAGAGAKDAGHVDGSGAIKHFSAFVRHRVLSRRVLAELEKQVSNVPNFQLFSHPTWHSRVSAWDLSLFTPITRIQGSFTLASAEVREANFQCTIVLRDESLTVEGLEGEARFDASSMTTSPEVLPLRKHNIGFSELPRFLLSQVATVLVSWVHELGQSLGLKASRDLFSVVFQLEGCDDIAIEACPDVRTHCINWWMRTWSPEVTDLTQTHEFGENGSHQNFLGPVDFDTLRECILDLVDLERNATADMFD